MTILRRPLFVCLFALLAARIAISGNVTEVEETGRSTESRGDAEASPRRPDAGDAAAGFSNCLALPGDCLTQGPSAAPDEVLSRLVLDYLGSARALELKGDAATARDDLGVLKHWNALIDAIRQRQAAARAVAPGKPTGLATVRLVEPLSGGISEGCTEQSGTLFSGDYLDADLYPDPGPLSELSIALECPGGDRETGTCQARVEVTAAGGPDGRGTGLDLVLREVPVRRNGPVWTFLDPRADASKPPGNRNTLFAALYDCRAGFGILSWGSLLDYDTWP